MFDFTDWVMRRPLVLIGLIFLMTSVIVVSIALCLSGTHYRIRVYDRGEIVGDYITDGEPETFAGGIRFTKRGDFADDALENSESLPMIIKAERIECWKFTIH